MTHPIFQPAACLLLVFALALPACTGASPSPTATAASPTTVPSALPATLPSPSLPALAETPTLSPGDNPSYAPALYPQDFADPSILRVDQTYYGFATDDPTGNHIPVIRSTDLVHWEALGDALPSLPAWVKPDSETWAPGAIRLGNAYLLYYAPQEKTSGTHCISVAAASRPEGPYKDSSTKPLICQSTCGANLVSSIDPYPFIDTSGQPYLLWTTGRDDACHNVAGIWSQPLAPDGLTLTGKPALLVTEDQYWEQGGVENPAILQDSGRTYVFYSANNWMSPSYAVGYAICESSAGPCSKPLDAPILAYDWQGTASGPGGETFFTDPSGGWYIAFHAWTAHQEGYPSGARSLRILRFSFENGKPVIHGPKEGPGTPRN